MFYEKKYYVLLGIILVAIAIVVGTSYAYFMANVTGGDNGSETVIKSGNLSLTLDDTNILSLDNAQPGNSASKEFTVTNTSKNTMTYNIKLVDVVNNFVDKNDLIYSLIGDNEVSIKDKVLPSVNDVYLVTNISIDPGVTHTYTLTIVFKETNDNQNDNMGVNFSGKINIDNESFSLISRLMKQYKVGSTSGLLKDTSNPNLYYYRGTNEEVSNNHLWYAGHHWRVLEFDTEEDTVTLITQQPLTSIHAANTVWSSKELFDSSYINTWLNEYFYNSLDSDIQNNILNNSYNVGIYNNVNEITTTKKVGLLNASQYTRGGYYTTFLNIRDNYYLGNRYDESRLYYVGSNGANGNGRTSISNGIRPVIKISNMLITEGDGTLTNSFRTEKKATNTSDVQIGEYINVPYDGGDGACGNDKICTFRVVSKDNDSIKIILNGLLSSLSVYGTSSTITTNATIYTTLNQFANNIASEYRYVGNKTYYIGDYWDNSNYLEVREETLSASVGLPIVGEMFSGNDIDLSTASDKIMVDINTVENPTISDYYWVMNRYSSSYVNYVDDEGVVDYYSHKPADIGGVRPTMYLKSGASSIKFTGGDGTAQNPYTLE